MAVKKIYSEIVKILVENKDKPVKEVMRLLYPITHLQRLGIRESVYATDGELLAVFCTYYKKWMPIVGPLRVDFSVKRASSTGFHPMCKFGQKAHRDRRLAYTKGKSALVGKIMRKEVAVEDIERYMAELKRVRDEKQTIDLGYAGLDSLVIYLGEQSYTVDSTLVDDYLLSVACGATFRNEET